MRYSRLQWTHSSPTEPVEILSEHDEDGWERRKVELFADGTMRFAGEGESTGGSQLSIIPRPPDEEVVSDREFHVAALSRSEFEANWTLARNAFLGAV